jgi:hypothetical protein
MHPRGLIVMRRAVGLLAIAASGVALSACGGGGRLAKVDFMREASRICRNGNAEAARIQVPPPSSDPAGASRALTRIATIGRATLADLRGLRPPKADGPAIDSWLAVIDQMLDETELARDALRERQPIAALEAIARATLLDGRARVLAQAAGIHPCRLPPLLPARST